MKSLLKELILTIAQILTFIYSFGIFFFAALTITGTGLGGAYPQEIREETVLLGILGAFYFIFPIWLLVWRLKKKVSKWEEILILLMGASPVILLLLISYFNL